MTPAVRLLEQRRIPHPGVDTMHVSGGRRGLELALAPSDLATLTNATVAAIAR